MLAQVLLVWGVMPGDPGANPWATAKWETTATLQPRAVGRLLGRRIAVGTTVAQVRQRLGQADGAHVRGAGRVQIEWYIRLGLRIDYEYGKVIKVHSSKR